MNLEMGERRGVSIRKWVREEGQHLNRAKEGDRIWRWARKGSQHLNRAKEGGQHLSMQHLEMGKRRGHHLNRGERRRVSI
jgi:hypothetical protein